jgi:hypothetical protein
MQERKRGGKVQVETIALQAKGRSIPDAVTIIAAARARRVPYATVLSWVMRAKVIDSLRIGRSLFVSLAEVMAYHPRMGRRIGTKDSVPRKRAAKKARRRK